MTIIGRLRAAPGLAVSAQHAALQAVQHRARRTRLAHQGIGFAPRYVAIGDRLEAQARQRPSVTADVQQLGLDRGHLIAQATITHRHEIHRQAELRAQRLDPCLGQRLTGHVLFHPLGQHLGHLDRDRLTL